ncbi:MAG: queuine tRNA-ribosyltransferase [Francisellaceae bacterium]|nr:queuine tRNA-ribosyltransferase [Francisellaceae bacterium]
MNEEIDTSILKDFDPSFNNAFGFEYSYPQPENYPRARLGFLKTPHGTIETPAFIFCGTKAVVKGLSTQDLVDENTQIILANTYHLMLQPGSTLIHKMGGLHQFMNWQGPMLTDSGGFQIFSLGHGGVSQEIKRSSGSTRTKTLLTVDEEGATFRSYINGQKYHLSPEYAITVQQELGADLIVVLDECTPFHIEKKDTESSMHRSHRWGLRSLIQFAKTRHQYAPQALYGIIQGGVYPDLRKTSIEFVNRYPFFGHAIGGSLGATKEQMYEVVDLATRALVANRPIHLLGIGGLRDIFNAVPLGIDTFDCVHPTRLARHGGALVPVALREDKNIHREHINLKNTQFSEDNSPINNECLCTTCKNYSRAYLHHLLKIKETLGLAAITQHNIHVMNQVMSEIRISLEKGTFLEVKQKWIS